MSEQVKASDARPTSLTDTPAVGSAPDPSSSVVVPPGGDASGLIRARLLALETAGEALFFHALHDDDCPNAGPCNCGLGDAQKAWRKAKREAAALLLGPSSAK